MATKAQLLDIATLIQIRMDNNYQALAQAVYSAGYNVSPMTPQGDMMKILIGLYKVDPIKAISILRDVPYNSSANNYTTSEEFRNKVLEITGQSSSGAKLSDWLQGLYKPATTTSVTNPTITTTPVNSTATTLGIIAIAITIVVLAYIMFK